MIEIRQKSGRKFCNIGALWYIFRKLLFARQVEVLIYSPGGMEGAYQSKKVANSWKPILGFQGRNRWQDISFRIFDKPHTKVLEMAWVSMDDKGNSWHVRDMRATETNVTGQYITESYILTRRRGEWFPILPWHPYPSNSFRYRVAIRRIK